MIPDGMIVWRSQHDGPETVRRIEQAIDAQGLKLFTRISHDDAAASVGLCMPFTHVLIFGGPRAGTPMMKRMPMLALDLPLRILVWEDDDGDDVWICTNDPEWIGTRHALLPEYAAQFDAMKHSLARIADAATGP